MNLALKTALLNLRDLLLTTGPVVVLAVAALVIAYKVLDPTPPKRVVLATGVAQGAYAEFGKRYQALLAEYGIAVELRETQGAAENLALLRDPGSGVDLAFVQGGADAGSDTGDGSAAPLVSLGSLFQEPVWLFYRDDSARRMLGTPVLERLNQLPGWRVNVGAPGSGAPVLVDKLLEANRLDPAQISLHRDPQTPAVVALLEGRLDALVMVSAPESLMVQMLLQTPGIRLFDFTQAEAYARRFAYMSPVVLPRGVVDLANDIPPADVHLIAPTATLVARAGTHPALLQLFVQATHAVHGEAGWFRRKGDFPHAANSELPLAPEAQRYFQSGTPWLQRYLPFWGANLIERMWPALLSIIAVLIPLSRLLPPIYAFRIRSRIFRWYAQLRAVEAAQGQRPADELVRELGDLDERVGRIAVPLSYTDELYALRGHIQDVRRRVEAAG